MKKLTIIFIAILVAVYAVLTLADLNGTYSAEKALWKINKEVAKLARDPDAVPNASFDKALKKYDNFIAKYPDSPLKSLAQVQKGQVYSVRKNNEKAREIFNSILKDVPKNDPTAVLVYNQIIVTYLQDKDMENVRATYNTIIKNVPFTEIGLRAPLLKALTYAMEKKEQQKQNSLAEALTYYRSLSEQYKNTELDFFSRYFAIETLTALKRWDESLKELEGILINFPDPRFLTSQHAKWILTRINGISINGLNDFERPANIYNKFIAKYPNHPLNAVLLKINTEIKAMKNKTQVSK
jgi:tetratricopeptide (TPR) repeat protein